MDLAASKEGMPEERRLTPKALYWVTTGLILPWWDTRLCRLQSSQFSDELLALRYLHWGQRSQRSLRDHREMSHRGHMLFVAWDSQDWVITAYVRQTGRQKWEVYLHKPIYLPSFPGLAHDTCPTYPDLRTGWTISSSLIYWLKCRFCQASSDLSREGLEHFPPCIQSGMFIHSTLYLLYTLSSFCSTVSCIRSSL